VRRGGAGVPFYRVEGGAGCRTGNEIGRPVVGQHYWPFGSVGRGNGGGEWGVKRRECGAISGRGGDARGGSARARGGDGCVRSASSRGRRKPGEAHAAVRVEGGGRLGRSEAKAQWGGRPAARPGRRRRPKRGGGVGLEGGRGLTEGGEMGRGPAEGQDAGGWWAGPEAADEQ
jgi:hypothetical protein